MGLLLLVTNVEKLREEQKHRRIWRQKRGS